MGCVGGDRFLSVAQPKQTISFHNKWDLQVFTLRHDTNPHFVVSITGSKPDLNGQTMRAARCDGEAASTASLQHEATNLGVCLLAQRFLNNMKNKKSWFCCLCSYRSVFVSLTVNMERREARTWMWGDLWSCWQVTSQPAMSHGSPEEVTVNHNLSGLNLFGVSSADSLSKPVWSGNKHQTFLWNYYNQSSWQRWSSFFFWTHTWSLVSDSDLWTRH